MTVQTFLDGAVTLHCGDNRVSLASIPDNSIDSVVTDPPYHLTSIVKRFGGENAAPAKFGKTGAYARASAGFMGCTWDAPEEPAIDPAFAGWFSGFVDGEGCFSVHKKQVNGYETYDCQFSVTLRADDKAIVFEMQRQLGGIGSVAMRPAPKSGNGKPQVRYCISSQRDCTRLRQVLEAFPLRAKKARDFEVWCHALDAWIAHEPGEGWDDVAYYREKLMAVRQYGAAYHPSQIFFYNFGREVIRVLKPGGYLVAFGGTRTYHRLVTGLEDAGFEIRDMLAYVFGSGFPKSHNLKGEHEGWGTALKPAHEPICLARKALIGTIAENVLTYGAGAINIDGCRVEASARPLRVTDPKATDSNVYVGRTGDGGLGKGLDGGSKAVGSTDLGRFPANLIHDGSDEVLACFPDAGGQQGPISASAPSTKTNNIYGAMKREGEASQGKRYSDKGATDFAALPGARRFDDGSAARFFYTAKADAEDRLGSKHPTVKPVDLMQYLVRLVTRKGGVVLDPFAGTGTTGEAAWREGMRAILMERDPEYQDDIARRMELAVQPTKRAAVAKTKNKLADPSSLPLFGGGDA